VKIVEQYTLGHKVCLFNLQSSPLIDPKWIHLDPMFDPLKISVIPINLYKTERMATRTFTVVLNSNGPSEISIRQHLSVYNHQSPSLIMLVFCLFGFLA
jgi:hypothetical protein